MPVPSLNLTDPEIANFVSLSFATNPIWYLRSEIRTALATEDLQQAAGRNLYLARISSTLALLGFLDTQTNEVVSALGAIELFPRRSEEHASRLRSWMTGEHRDESLDAFSLGTQLRDVPAFVARTKKMSETLVEHLDSR